MSLLSLHAVNSHPFQRINKFSPVYFNHQSLQISSDCSLSNHSCHYAP